MRRQHSLVEICKTPKLAAEVTITAAEELGVDAAIIFADLLLPLEVHGGPFRFESGEGPVIEAPVRTAADIAMLDEDSGGELGYVARIHPAGNKAFWNEAAGDRFLRSSVYPGQLHDRRRRFAAIHGNQKVHVPLARRPGMSCWASW